MADRIRNPCPSDHRPPSIEEEEGEGEGEEEEEEEEEGRRF